MHHLLWDYRRTTRTLQQQCVELWCWGEVQFSLNSFPSAPLLTSLHSDVPTHSHNVFVVRDHCEAMLPTLLSRHTNERSRGGCRSFITGAVGCPCLAVPCLGSGCLHCGLGVIINPLGLSRSPLVIWDCWVSICKGHDDKATRRWRRSRRGRIDTLTDELKSNWKIRPLS